MRTTENNKKALRNQILIESVQILGERGFEGLSLREVAKKLKVTHQAPYHYFPDKNAIVHELKKIGFALLGEEIEKGLQKSSNPRDVVENIGLTYFDFCLQNPGYFRAMFAPNAATESSVRVVEAQHAFSCLKSAIERFPERAGQDSEITAMIVWTYMHGLVSLAMDKYPVLGGKYETRELAQKMVAEMSKLLGV